jgi:hypothetical protein
VYIEANLSTVFTPPLSRKVDNQLHDSTYWIPSDRTAMNLGAGLHETAAIQFCVHLVDIYFAEENNIHQL